jgi:uncharacterized OB-fold protein
MSRNHALPDLEFEATRGFWQAARQERLEIPRCGACARYTWYPAPSCAHCGAEALEWSPVSGRGTIFSWSVVTRALFKAFREKTPYITGLVALEEDPDVRLVTLFVDCEAGDLGLDQPAEVVFRRLEFPGVESFVTAPMFRPIAR